MATTSYVILNDMRLYAYHGVLPQERRVGGWYTVSLRVGCDFSRAMVTDNMDDSVSYADLAALVRREMATPSRLLEHVAGRVVRAVEMELPLAQSVSLTIIKDNPPMGADCNGAGVELHWHRNE